MFILRGRLVNDCLLWDKQHVSLLPKIVRCICMYNLIAPGVAHEYIELHICLQFAQTNILDQMYIGLLLLCFKQFELFHQHIDLLNNGGGFAVVFG